MIIPHSQFPKDRPSGFAARVAVDALTKELVIEGRDNYGSTSVTESGDDYTITDQAGHATKLTFGNTTTQPNLMYIKLQTVQYDEQPIISLPETSFLYVWNQKTPQSLITQTIAVKDQYLASAWFDERRNQTTVYVKEKGKRLQIKRFPGLHLLQLAVNDGVVGYEL